MTLNLNQDKTECPIHMLYVLVELFFHQINCVRPCVLFDVRRVYKDGKRVWLEKLEAGVSHASLCHLNPNLVSHHHEMASLPLDEVCREGCSVSSNEGPLKKAAKPVWAHPLIRLPCLVV